MPGFKHTDGFSMEVEQIIPAEVIKYQNTYGNGKFTIKIKNLTETAQVMPSLFEKTAKS